MTNELAVQTADSRPILFTPPPQTMVKRSILTMSDSEFIRLDFLAKTVAASALSYAKDGSNRLSEQDVKIIMIKGLEVGLEPLAALDFINIIKGKPTLSPAGMLALINAHNVLENMTIIERTKTRSTIMMKRVGRSEWTNTFTIEDAAKILTQEKGSSIPLTEKYNWKQMPDVMLQWRNVSAMCKVLFPDILGGLRYTEEEMGANVSYDDAGNTIYMDLPPQPQRPPQPPAEQGDPRPPTVPPPDPKPQGETSVWHNPAIEPLKIIAKKAKTAGMPDDDESLAFLAGVEQWTIDALAEKYPTKVNDAWAAMKSAYDKIKADEEANKGDKPKAEQPPANGEDWRTQMPEYVKTTWGIEAPYALNWIRDFEKNPHAGWETYQTRAEAEAALFHHAVAKGYPVNIHTLTYHKPTAKGSFPYLSIDGLPQTVFILGDEENTARDLIRNLDDEALTKFIDSLEPAQATAVPDEIQISAIIEKSETNSRHRYSAMHPLYVNMDLTNL